MEVSCCRSASCGSWSLSVCKSWKLLSVLVVNVSWLLMAIVNVVLLGRSKAEIIMVLSNVGCS